MTYLKAKKWVLIELTLIYFMNKVHAQNDVSCDFERDFCGYSPNEFVTRFTGASPSVTSGPQGDHTYGDGFYALCDGRLLRDIDDKCELSQMVTLQAEARLHFWYHMSGFQIGTLELSAAENVLWSLTGRQEDRWLLADVLLPLGNYQLKFSANRSIDGRISSDIGIDDISLEGQALTTNIVTVPRTTPSLVALNVSDEFDEIISWKSEYEFNQWTAMTGNLSGFLGSYGPGSDWTSLSSDTELLLPNVTGLRQCAIPYSLERNPANPVYYCSEEFIIVNRTRAYFFVCGTNEFPETSSLETFVRCKLGKYLMITNDKFDTPLNQIRSRLYSPVFSLPDDEPRFCLKFKYNIYSSSNDGFNLAIENYSNYQQRRVLFSITGREEVDRWYSAEVPVPRIYDLNRFFIEPIRATEFKNYASISIDSVNLYYEDCGDPFPTESTMETTEETTEATTEETTSEETTTEEETTTLPSTPESTKQTTQVHVSTDLLETAQSSSDPNQETKPPITQPTKTDNDMTYIYAIIGIGGFVVIGILGSVFARKYYIKKENDKIRPKSEDIELK